MRPSLLLEGWDYGTELRFPPPTWLRQPDASLGSIPGLEGPGSHPSIHARGHPPACISCGGSQDSNLGTGQVTGQEGFLFPKKRLPFARAPGRSRSLSLRTVLPDGMSCLCFPAGLGPRQTMLTTRFSMGALGHPLCPLDLQKGWTPRTATRPSIVSTRPSSYRHPWAWRRREHPSGQGSHRGPPLPGRSRRYPWPLRGGPLRLLPGALPALPLADPPLPPLPGSTPSVSRKPC